MWLKDRRAAAVCTLLLFALNLWMVRELLTTEYLAYMGSIEGARIAISRWILENWGDLSWFPLWYGGIPFQNTYPPLYHALVAALAGLGGITPALAYHMLSGIFYALGPVTLFWLALRLSGSWAYSLAASLFYSLISPAAFLIPSVRLDLVSVWHPRRMQSLVLYGEGPHVAALTLLPMALWLLQVAFEKRRAGWWILAGLGMASVVLTNWLAGVELGLAVLAWLLASQGISRWRQWLWVVLLGLCAYALVSPWLPPSTVRAFARSPEFQGGGYSSALSQHWRLLAAGLLGLGVMGWAFRRFKWPTILRFSALFLYPAALLTLSAGWSDLSSLPHRMRFNLMMEMGIALLVAFAAKTVLDRLSPRLRIATACTLLILGVYPALRHRQYARLHIRAAEVRKTIEYREAEWLDQHMKGGRVLVPGSVSFFLNVFRDTPQFAGGFDPGLINPVLPAIYYQIVTGEHAGRDEGHVAVFWLRAFGVDAVAMSGPRSAEFYKPFRNPNKFAGILPELVREGDDVIYQVPRRSRSLAHVIGRSDLPARPPADGLDLGPIWRYVAALENPALPEAQMSWRNRHSAVISARLEKDQILTVQISYHPGWRASVNGQPRRTFDDRLGQLAVEPQCQGPCSVEITYDGGREMTLARLASWSAILAGLGWILAEWRRARRTPRTA